MSVIFHEPVIELKPYVRSIWSFQSDRGLSVSERTVIAPTGNAKLILSCENRIVVHADGRQTENRERTAYFLGVRDVPVSLHTSDAPTLFIGVEFYPHSAYPLSRVPMSELTNRLVFLDELLGDIRTQVEPVLDNERSTESKIDLIQRLLIRRLDGGPGVNSVVEYCINRVQKAWGLLSIAELESQTGYSRRYLEMLFKNHVGKSPKSFSRIVRFQKLYRTWAETESYE